jgi:hypothetical protein
MGGVGGVQKDVLTPDPVAVHAQKRAILDVLDPTTLGGIPEASSRNHVFEGTNLRGVEWRMRGAYTSQSYTKP